MPTGWRYALSSSDEAPNTAPILLHGDVLHNLKTAASLGYQGLEIHTRENIPLDYGEIARASTDLGVSISAVVTGRLNTKGKVNLLDDRPYVYSSAMSCMWEYIKMASRLKTDVIIGWIRGSLPSGENSAPYLERLAKTLIELGQEAKNEAVRILIEVINRYETNVFTTAQETVAFLDKWGISNCYIHLDTFHMNIEEINPVAAIRLCGPRLGYFHVADNTRLYPGSGTLQFQNYFSALKEIGYEGFVSLECLPRPDGETAAKRAIEYLRQCEP